ncbi:urease subunit beta [Methylorubrum rhodesianum]|uniref:Urease subunit beta n=1 Tax=Methylorubrum rhodesianum TaxID=29427 RepID=A0ABU9Z467_9HYPH|nr:MULTISPECIES: urease subunit beta [Methylorubrum]MBY0143562.1 urease subunit beta [Methylorubrum populi]MRI57592.1 urease subunit beta [Methylobacterium sp. DB1607]MBB5760745.1 urease subunit beta [Methylorubrum rhodesianum]MBI1692204.1 urease subunit beta [Methylorubrum sp. DB1722]MBK3403661.1 urease subunit beta [Methylorubrum rhodesianum]
MSPAQKKTPVGGIIFGSGDIEINAGYPTTSIKVRNTGDRPIQVGSHYHFFEVNASLEFDRQQAFGKRLNIPATTALRFEPGDEKEVSLVPFQGKQRVLGFNGLVNGWVGDESYDDYRPRLADALDRVNRFGFKNKP